MVIKSVERHRDDGNDATIHGRCSHRRECKTSVNIDHPKTPRLLDDDPDRTLEISKLIEPPRARPSIILEHPPSSRSVANVFPLGDFSKSRSL